jgi:hypothetical protein
MRHRRQQDWRQWVTDANRRRQGVTDAKRTGVKGSPTPIRASAGPTDGADVADVAVHQITGAVGVAVPLARRVRD